MINYDKFINTHANKTPDNYAITYLQKILQTTYFKYN